ncbi:hypothetical protein VL07_13295 [Bacillus safensis]|nr:hypothetical protein VL07_13295 [Bacillus safensis]KML49739.1 hypothetical protein VL18_14805 [Bacillus safensis]KMN81000.1 hypothetical protein VK99_03290 [Bacillus safensis]
MLGERVLLREPVKQSILQKKEGCRQGQCSYKWDSLQMKKIKSFSKKAELKKTDWIGLGHIKHNVICLSYYSNSVFEDDRRFCVYKCNYLIFEESHDLECYDQT